MSKKILVIQSIFLYFLLIGDGCTNQKVVIEFPKVDKNKAFNYLLDQVNIGYRYIGTEAHVICGDYIKERIEKYADRVEVQNFYIQFRSKDVSCRNIIGFFDGKNNENRFLLGAHYDTRPVADMDRDYSKRDQPILGANDGASGVAVLLSIAESLHKQKPDRSIIMVFFDAEDAGGIDGLTYCIGSDYFSKNMSQYKIYYGIVIDMVGDSDLLIYKELYSLNYAHDLVVEMWRSAWMEGYSSKFSYRQRYNIFDDHVPLNKQGVPTIDIIDFDYPYWHTLEDTPDKCSSESLSIVGNSVLNFIYNSSFGINPE